MTLIQRSIAETLGESILFVGLLVNEPYDKICFALLCGVWVYTTYYVPPHVSLEDYVLTAVAFYRVCDGLDYLVIRDAANKLRYKNQTRPASGFPLLQRAKWAAILLSSPRGIGWEHVNANTIPRHAPIKSRSFFVFRTLVDIVVHTIISTIAGLQIPHNPAFFKSGPRLTELQWTWRLHGIFTCIVLQYCVLQLHYLSFCVLVVICGFFAPEDCPPIFGSVFECFNIRRIWGRTWHQLFRRPFLSIAIILGHGVLRLKLGSVSFGIVISIVSFLTTGIMHYFGDYVVLGGYGGGSMRFFYGQWIAILVEVAAEEIVRNCFELKSNFKIATSNSSPTPGPEANGARLEIRFRPPRRGTRVSLVLRLSGYFYVIAWLYYTMPIILDPILSTGILQEDSILKTWVGLTTNGASFTIRQLQRYL